MKVKVGDIVYIEIKNTKGFCRIFGRKMDFNFFECNQIKGNLKNIQRYEVAHIQHIKAVLPAIFDYQDVLNLNPESFKEDYPEFFI
jgi:hypothetical protein